MGLLQRSIEALELLAFCRAELDSFLKGAPRGDDLTLVGVRAAA